MDLGLHIMHAGSATAVMLFAIIVYYHHALFYEPVHTLAMIKFILKSAVDH